jgi:hypothetical protein
MVVLKVANNLFLKWHESFLLQFFVRTL